MPHEEKVTHGKELPFIWSEINSFCIFAAARLKQPVLGQRQMLMMELQFSEALCIFR